MSAEPGRNRRWAGVVRVSLGVLLPLLLVLTNVRLLLTPAFVSVEYTTPGFPDDAYGFTQGERVQLAQLARQYLLDRSGIEFLAVQRASDGSPLYNERELSHMVDVKTLVQQALTLWYLLLALVGLLLLIGWRIGGRETVRRGLRLGGTLTLAAMAALLTLLVAGFSLLFTGFHSVFFESGTWVFYYSDTLIRLFPMRFWRDVFALLILLTLAEGALLLLVTRNPHSSVD
jgi:integral membrane protein (TIGR01906 family)